MKEKKKKQKKYKKTIKGEDTTQKRAKGFFRDRQKVYQDFFKKLGKNDLKNRDYEKFFKRVWN